MENIWHIEEYFELCKINPQIITNWKQLGVFYFLFYFFCKLLLAQHIEIERKTTV